MKALLMTVLALGIMSSSQVKAADYNYECISQRMQAMNSDIYYNLSPAEIYSMLTIPEMFGHIDAVNANKQCEKDAKLENAYQCIADGLQAYNSSVYYNLSRSDIDSMLNIPEMFGHIDAVRVARACGAY